MGNLANGTALGFKFISTGSWNKRNPQQLTEDELNSGNIIFIQATNQIYAGGIYIGITPDQASLLSSVSSDVSALKEKVGTTSKLSQTLLAIANDLKSKLDGGSYDINGNAGNAISVKKIVDGQEVTVTNVVDAINVMYGNITSLVAGVSSVNGKSGSVTLLGTDISVSGSNSDTIDQALDKKVTISNDTTVNTNTGKKASDYTNTKVIGDAIEVAHAAAISANNNADGRIAKSSEDQIVKTISGAQGSNLDTAAAIASAIETACERLIQSSNPQDQRNWGQNELKTLTTLRNLIKDVNDRFDTLTNGDLDKIQKSITAIKNELGGDEQEAQLVNSLLDAISTILPTKENNTYTFNIGSGEGTIQVTTIQEVINQLMSKIDNAAGSGVTKITPGDGISVNNNGVGNVTVNANSNAKLSAALTTINNGAVASENDTIQTALNNINTVAAQGVGDAAAAASAASDAASAAASAASDANTALNQLKWIVE